MTRNRSTQDTSQFSSSTESSSEEGSSGPGIGYQITSESILSYDESELPSGMRFPDWRSDSYNIPADDSTHFYSKGAVYKFAGNLQIKGCKVTVYLGKEEHPMEFRAFQNEIYYLSIPEGQHIFKYTRNMRWCSAPIRTTIGYLD